MDKTKTYNCRDTNMLGKEDTSLVSEQCEGKAPYLTTEFVVGSGVAICSLSCVALTYLGMKYRVEF
jgi:hypothetical protein